MKTEGPSWKGLVRGRPFATRIRGPGFTLIELTVTLALMAVLMGLVVVRFSWGGPRQQLIGQARKLGNLILSYREKARTEERLYALWLDAPAGEYTIVSPKERTAEAAGQARPIHTVRLPGPIRFGRIRQGREQRRAPLMVFFTPRGIVPGLIVELRHPKGPRILLKVAPLTNDIEYDEP